MLVVLDIAAVALDATTEAVVLRGHGSGQRHEGKDGSELHFECSIAEFAAVWLGMSCRKW